MLWLKAPLSFTAKVIPGSGRGKLLGVPTYNLDLQSVPGELAEGIYAVRARAGESEAFQSAVMHYGPRPVFEDSRSCEVHLLEVSGFQPSPRLRPAGRFQVSELTIEVVEKLREVRDFESAEALQRQMAKDIAEAASLLHSRHHEPE